MPLENNSDYEESSDEEQLEFKKKPVIKKKPEPKKPKIKKELDEIKDILKNLDIKDPSDNTPPPAPPAVPPPPPKRKTFRPTFESSRPLPVVVNKPRIIFKR